MKSMYVCVHTNLHAYVCLLTHQPMLAYKYTFAITKPKETHSSNQSKGGFGCSPIKVVSELGV